MGECKQSNNHGDADDDDNEAPDNDDDGGVSPADVSQYEPPTAPLLQHSWDIFAIWQSNDNKLLKTQRHEHRRDETGGGG